MDEENLNFSFNGLFEGNADRGWIITKNEKGKVKVARCREDEMDDLYISRTDWVSRNIPEDETTQQTSIDDVPKWKLYGTSMFLIRDMLNCETKDGYFVCKGVPFTDVLVCGTVVSISIRFDKYAIIVDDGTSSIMCLIKKEELEALRFSEEEKQSNRVLIETFRANPTDPMLKINAIMMGPLNELVKNVPTFDDLKPGDVVTLMGTLSEYKNNRYVFIKSIEREPEDSTYHMTYLEEMLELYENVYPEFTEL